jgi:LysM repeat protein
MVKVSSKSEAGGGARAAASSVAGTYVVRAGDTLYAIAQRFNTGLDALLSLNSLSKRSVIQPGLRLRLP